MHEVEITETDPLTGKKLFCMEWAAHWKWVTGFGISIKIYRMRLRRSLKRTGKILRKSVKSISVDESR